MNTIELEKLQSLADWMDSRFVVPGTSIRFGLDSLLGLIPGVGDSVTVISTGYLLHHAKIHDVPKHIRFKMIWNAFVDWLIGLVPLVGDVFDVGWKANQRNVALMRAHFEREVTPNPFPEERELKD